MSLAGSRPTRGLLAMFVGHYGVSFAAKRFAPTTPLWVLFIAVQLLDVFWAPFILLGIEKVRIVPGSPLLIPSISTTCLTPTASWRPSCGQVGPFSCTDCRPLRASAERRRLWSPERCSRIGYWTFWCTAPIYRFTTTQPSRPRPLERAGSRLRVGGRAAVRRNVAVPPYHRDLPRAYDGLRSRDVSHPGLRLLWAATGVG